MMLLNFQILLPPLVLFHSSSLSMHPPMRIHFLTGFDQLLWMLHRNNFRSSPMKLMAISFIWQV